MPNHNPSPETRFAPGRSGNPSGRPRGESLSKAVRRRLAEPDEGGGSKLDRLAGVIVDRALAGDLRFVEALWARLEGKAPLVAEPEEEQAEGHGDAFAEMSVEEMTTLVGLMQKTGLWPDLPPVAIDGVRTE